MTVERGRRSLARLARAVAALCTAGTLCLAGCDDTPTSVDVVAADRFDEVWARYELAYPSFAFRDVDWDAARVRWRPQAETASSPAALAAAVRSLLGELRDRQAAVISPRGDVLRAYQPVRSRNFERDRWVAALAGRGYVVRNGGAWGSATLGGIPYLLVDEWNDGGGASFLNEWDRVLDAAASAPALVLDLRSATGGDEFTAFAAIGRFTDRPRSAGFTRVRERGPRDSLGVFVPRTLNARPRTPFLRPVVVLVGAGTYALSEAVVSALRALPQVTVVGDTTLGSSGNPEVRPLVGGWSYSIQRWVEYTADREPIEGRGIAPDDVVPWSPSAAEPGIDPLLLHALDRARTLGAASGAVTAPAHR